MRAGYVRRLGGLVVGVLAVPLLNGCIVFPQYPETYGYVLKMRDPERITEWALAQTDEKKIGDAMLALSHLRIRQPDNPEVRDRAKLGFLRVHEKLRSGWTGFKADPNRGDTDAFGDLPADIDARHLELTVRFGYYVAVQFGGTVWDQIKPPPEQRARLASWTFEGRRVGWTK